MACWGCKTTAILQFGTVQSIGLLRLSPTHKNQAPKLKPELWMGKPLPRIMARPVPIVTRPVPVVIQNINRRKGRDIWFLSTDQQSPDSLQCDQILDAVCDFSGFEKSEITGSKRLKRHVYFRKIFLYLARKHTNKSLVKISKMINRNHTTAMWSIARVKRDYSSYYPDISGVLEVLRGGMIDAKRNVP